ncbi:MAG: CdaR family protein [bacterium]
MFKLIFRKYGFIPVAFLLAVLLWLHITTENIFTKDISVPLEIINVPENLRIANRVPDTAVVSVTAQGKDLISFKFSDAVIYIHAQDAKYGEYEYEIKHDLENISFLNFQKVAVKRIKSPNKITVVFDSKYKRTVLIKPDISVNLIKDYTMVGNISAKPESVTVLGPRSVVSAIDNIPTKNVVLDGVKKDTSFYVFLKKPEVGSIMLSPNKIRVSFQVEKMQKQVISNIAVQLINAPKGSRLGLTPPTVSILIAGAYSRVEKVSANPSMISAVIDYNRFFEEDKKLLAPNITVFEDVQWDLQQPGLIRLVKMSD